jgi:hypothetical protein
MDVRTSQDLPVAFTEPAAQLVLVGENAVLGESSELDIPIEHHDLVPLLGHDVGDSQAGGTGPDDNHQVFGTHRKCFRSCAPILFLRQK